MVKSVLLNSADKIPGWSNGQIPHANGFGGVKTNQSLDYVSGAGALNLERAFDQYHLDTNTRDVPETTSGNQGRGAAVGWDFGNVQSGTANVYPIENQLEGGSELTVTLGWFRERSYNPTSTQTFDTAQADLNLIVRDTNTNNIVSESSSTCNVVEHLSFDLPSTSFYQIEVGYSGNLFGAIDNEDYGLAWSGVAFPGPTTLNGDYDDSSEVALGDLNLVLFNWQVDGATLTNDWINHRPVARTTVGISELNGVLFNWGNSAPVVAVPEPAAGMLALWGVLLWAFAAVAVSPGGRPGQLQPAILDAGF